MKIKTQFDPTYKGTPNSPEEGWGESQTVPEMHLTISELVRNYTRGINSNVHMYQAEYFEDTPIPQIEDLTDLQNYKADLKAQLDDLNAQATQLQETQENASETLKNASEDEQTNRTEQTSKGTNVDLEQVKRTISEG